MITHIRMKNFKSWGDSGKVELAPLTGFFGTNSSGKSSLLQMLLLLKQTAERSDLEEVIFFGDENSLVNLGNFREVIHGHSSGAYLEFELGCRLTHPPSIYNIPEGGSPREQRIDPFTFHSFIQFENSQSIVEWLSYRFAHGVSEAITYEKGSVFLPSRYGEEGDRRKIKLDTCYGKTSDAPGASKSVGLLSKLSSAFEELFSHVYYLGPTRVDSRRHYGWEGAHPAHIRQWGDQTIDALLSARVRDLKTSHDEEKVPIEQRVSYWLQEMDLAHSFSLNWMDAQGSKTYEVRIQKTSSSPPVTLVDMGYGLTQFLPVLVLCYYAPEGSTLILEQPGIHLHPKVQAQLADLLIEIVNERNLRILIESHSEHLLNRLQRRIAEEKMSADDTALYFCRNDKGVSEIERLKLDEFGNIANWPENFFGDEMGDLFAMTQAQMERQQRTEG